MSKQAILQTIRDNSIRRVRENLVAGALDEFEQRLKLLPQQLKELNADPYMFIFDILLTHRDSVQYVLLQYEKMIDQSFLNPDSNAQTLAQQFRQHLENHSYKIIQILMKIKKPNPIFFKLFFQIHNAIPMPENILNNFRRVGYQWLARAFDFKRYPRPPYIHELAGNVLKIDDSSFLPSLEDQQFAIKKYVQKKMMQIIEQVVDQLQTKDESKKKKYGFCFMCRSPAGYYCKDTKISVCGSDCKKAHINFIYNNSCLDYQFGTHFKQQLEDLLFNNIRMKKNIALTVDFLCSICINSSYVPQSQFPYRQLLSSPIISERIWILFLLYHFKKGLVFQHVFADALTNPKANIRQTTQHYFMKIIQTDRLMQVFESVDFMGRKKIFKILLKKLQKQNQVKLIYSLINHVFSHSNLINHQMVKNYENVQSRLLRALNHEKDPIPTFTQVFGEQNWLQNYIKVGIRNQDYIIKSKFSEMVMKNDQHCRQFLKIIIEPIKQAPVDEIIREIFYFVNVKESQRIYHLFQLLCEVYEPPQMFSYKKDSFFLFSYLVLMIVTEFLNNQQSKKPNLAQFLQRVKNFDSLLWERHRQELTQTYNRLAQHPFSSENRGILTYYPQIPIQKNMKNFSPILSLLDNWQSCYDIMSDINNDTTVLYRVCSVLIDNAALCQPFLQLLINKVGEENTEEHLIPSINSIIQEQPNAVGTSWRLIFSVNQTTKTYKFQLPALIHCSKQLTDSNFISFVKELINSCSSVSPSTLFGPCLKLIAYNRQRIETVKRQIIQLFAFEYNAYSQIEFMKAIFNLQLYEIGTTMLDIVAINMVTQPFIAQGLIDIVNTHHNELTPEAWNHIINKILMLGCAKLQQGFSECLRAYPQCQQYFQQLNIQRAIVIPFDGGQQTINPQLVYKLHKLQSHIPQMKQTVLRQFIRAQNLQTIIKHFIYFYPLSEVYNFLQTQTLSNKDYEHIYFIIQSKLKDHIINAPEFVFFTVGAIINISSQQLKTCYYNILSTIIQHNLQSKEFIQSAYIILSFLTHCLELGDKVDKQMLSYVSDVYGWAKQFNNDENARNQAWKQQSLKQLKQPPSLLKQENISFILMLKLKQLHPQKHPEILTQFKQHLQSMVGQFRIILQQKKKKKQSQKRFIYSVEYLGELLGIMGEWIRKTASPQDIKQINIHIVEILESGLMNYNVRTGEFSGSKGSGGVLQFYRRINE